ncbi:hypothetical protein [Thiobacillus denitrificans]|uniref:hypothetical protein n=1 Tax=Thiobacillus denitrificans TaxID=36861 RepID=UPI0012F98DB1|nr:hypothetical protein [Thiobacillus denitrificans]
MTTSFNWVRPDELKGDWVLSNDGELCKATCMNDGNYLVMRGHRPGVWIGNAAEYHANFRKMGESSPARSFMF